MKTQLNFHIISMATYGKGLSGGDRIWIELAKKFGKRYPTIVYVWEEGMTIAKREGLRQVRYTIWSAKSYAELGFFVNYSARILIGLYNTSRLQLINAPETVIYSASEFWQDSLPAFVLKLRYPKVKWLAAWYQTAPNPFIGYSEGGRTIRFRFKAFLYWFVQLPIKPLIKNYADLVIVNNESEKKEFPEMTKKNKVFVMLGAVDLDKIKAYQAKHKNIHKIYDGIFQGRFHPQKGVVELIDIWKIVVESKPQAMLAMIGDGPLMSKVRNKIKEYRLENNVKLFGYLFDGSQKYQIFSQSTVVLHPSFYDSGGMASAEAMAFGLPVLGFDLDAYNSYYPKGMLRVKIGDIEGFAHQILRLLNNLELRNKIGQEGLWMLESNWSWKIRAKSLLECLSGNYQSSFQ